MLKEKVARIIIAGGRKFNDYELLKNKVDFYLSDLVNKNYIIIEHPRSFKRKIYIRNKFPTW